MKWIVVKSIKIWGLKRLKKKREEIEKNKDFAAEILGQRPPDPAPPGLSRATNPPIVGVSGAPEGGNGK